MDYSKEDDLPPPYSETDPSPQRNVICTCGSTQGAYTSNQPYLYQCSYTPGQSTEVHLSVPVTQVQSTQRDEEIVVDTQPSATPVPTVPDDYMARSILVCIFCFCPTGILAIIYSKKRTSMLVAGDIVEAHKSAKCARHFVFTSVVLGICWILTVAVLGVVV